MASSEDPASSAAPQRSFQLGRSVTVNVPEAVADQITNAFAERFGRRKASTSRSGRGRVPAERLSIDRILEVTLDQMRTVGYDGVTMRSIARELETGPASLYAHVSGREELDSLVVDRVARLFTAPEPDPARWDEQLVEALSELHRIFLAHPGVARATMGMIPLQPGSLAATEGILRLLSAGDVPEQDAAWFIDVAMLYIGANAVEDDIWRRRAAASDDPEAAQDPEAHVGPIREFMLGLPAEHFPLVASMAVALTSGDGEERFAFGLDLLVSGLRARAERTRSSD